MTLEDLKKLPLLHTRAIAAAAADEETFYYLLECLNAFYSGNYGEICEEDTAYNNEDLAEGAGHVLARYKAKGKLTGDIYIEAHFDKDHLNDINYSQTLIMYPSER